MSERQQFPVYPKPVWPVDKQPAYQPVDTITHATKVTLCSGLILGGMHFRRMLQHRKGSARPGHARYLALFEFQRHHFISAPLAAGMYVLVSDSLYNLNEETRASAEVAAVSSALFVASMFKSMPMNTRIGISLGYGLATGLFFWAGKWGLGEASLRATRSRGEVHDQESNKSLDSETEMGKYRKQGFWETMYRRPLSQTVDEIGEGRGIVRL
ncbi:hypothetical protein KL906_000182 [Ogataea polymorpha]|nr:hypothetical protein KL906_000182 [Ogataea polymorpha]